MGVRRVFLQAEFDKREAETVARELGAEIISIDPLNYNWRDEMLRIVECLKKQ
jgi:zinc transport system substrate-binding protein